jgi:hypothetical protein
VFPIGSAPEFSHKDARASVALPGLRHIGQLVANDTKVSRNTFVQLFSPFLSGLMGGRYINTKEPESADEHGLSE